MKPCTVDEYLAAIDGKNLVVKTDDNAEYSRNVWYRFGDIVARATYPKACGEPMVFELADAEDNAKGPLGVGESVTQAAYAAFSGWKKSNNVDVGVEKLPYAHELNREQHAYFMAFHTAYRWSLEVETMMRRAGIADRSEAARCVNATYLQDALKGGG